MLSITMGSILLRGDTWLEVALLVWYGHLLISAWESIKALQTRKVCGDVTPGNFLNYCIAGNFQERKFSRIGEKYDFCGENFCGLLLQHQRCHTPKFCGKTFANSHKTAKFMKVFSLESFLLAWSSDLLVLGSLV